MLPFMLLRVIQKVDQLKYSRSSNRGEGGHIEMKTGAEGLGGNIFMIAGMHGVHSKKLDMLPNQEIAFGFEVDSKKGLKNAILIAEIY